MHRIAAIFQKSFYAWTRLPVALFFTFAFPLLFLTVFALAFHHGVYSPEPTLDLAVENQDRGLSPDLAGGPSVNFGTLLLQTLSNLQYPESGRPIFSIREVQDTSGIAEALRKGRLQLFLRIPEDFSVSVLAYAQTRVRKSPENPDTSLKHPKIQVQVPLYGVAGTVEYAMGRQILQGTIQGFLEAVSDSLARRWQPQWQPPPEPEFRLVPHSVAPSDLTVFDYIVAGYFLFNVLMLIIGFTQSLVMEREQGYHDLYRLTHLRAHEYLLGEAGVFFAIGGVQVVFFYGIARLMGFTHHGSLTALVLPLAFGFLSAMGLVYLLAAWIEHHKTATAVANTVGLILGFVALSGSGFPLPNPTIFHRGTFSFGLLDLFPWRHAAVILKTTFVQGEPLSQVFLSTGLLMVETAMFLGLGMLLFHRRILKRSGSRGIRWSQ